MPRVDQGKSVELPFNACETKRTVTYIDVSKALMWDKTEIGKHTHQWRPEEQQLGFEVVHVCFVEAGHSVLGLELVRRSQPAARAPDYSEHAL